MLSYNQPKRAERRGEWAASRNWLWGIVSRQYPARPFGVDQKNKRMYFVPAARLWPLASDKEREKQRCYLWENPAQGGATWAAADPPYLPATPPASVGTGFKPVPTRSPSHPDIVGMLFIFTATPSIKYQMPPEPFL